MHIPVPTPTPPAQTAQRQEQDQGASDGQKPGFYCVQTLLAGFTRKELCYFFRKSNEQIGTECVFKVSEFFNIHRVLVNSRRLW